MKKRKFSFIGACVLALAITGCSGVVNGLEPNRLNTYLDGYTATTITAGTNGSTCKVNSTEDNGVKVGTSNKGGDLSIAIPANTTELVFYAAAWKGVTGLSLNITTGNANITVGNNSISLTADDGISGNSPFTLSGNENDFKFTLNVTGASVATSFTFTTSTNKRFVMWDAQVKTSSGGQQGPVSLKNPSPVWHENENSVTWTKDDNADDYEVKIDNDDYSSVGKNTSSHNVGTLDYGTHTVWVKAVGDGVNYSSVEASVEFTLVEPFNPTVYALCTNAKELEAGATYIITGGTNGTVVTMSTTSESGYRHLTEVNANDSKISSTEETLILTLEGNTGEWKFKTENYLGTNGYFAPSSGSSNELKIVDSENADTCTISFNQSVANIKFSSNSRGYVKSIARALVEYIHTNGKGAKTLFATHYHELNDLEGQYPRVKNYHIAVKEEGKNVIFLRKLQPGGVAHSFGIHVARLAGMPREVIESAEKTLRDLERREKHASAMAMEDDGSVQLSFFQLDDPTLTSLKEKLEAADLNNMTPLQAFDLLRSLKVEIGLND